MNIQVYDTGFRNVSKANSHPMKISNLLKCIFVFCSLLFIAGDLFAADGVLIRKDNDPKPPIGVPVVPTESTAMQSVAQTTENATYATISAYDAEDLLIYQTTVTTETTEDLSVYTDNLPAGTCSVVIEYETANIAQ